MKTLGIIGGNGKWGQNFIKLSGKLQYKTLIGTRDNWKELIQSKQCDGIVIATHPDSHVDIAIEALEHKLPVMIEKPLAWNLQDALRLKKYEKEVSILVNNLHLFSPAFKYIVEHVNPNDIFQIISTGTNTIPSKFENSKNYSTIIDYAFHDLSMGLYLVNSFDQVKLDLILCQPKGLGEIWNLTLAYFSFIKHKITAGNAGSSKTRNFEVITSEGDIFFYDDMVENKLSINGKPQKIENISTLENSIKHFLMSIDGYTDNRFGLDLSLKTLSILEECENLIKED